MSRENIELVRRAIDGLNRRDIEASLALFHPDVEIDWTRSRGPLQGVYRGHSGLESLWNEFWTTSPTGPRGLSSAPALSRG